MLGTQKITDTIESKIKKIELKKWLNGIEHMELQQTENGTTKKTPRQTLSDDMQANCRAIDELCNNKQCKHKLYEQEIRSLATHQPKTEEEIEKVVSRKLNIYLVRGVLKLFGGELKQQSDESDDQGPPAKKPRH